MSKPLKKFFRHLGHRLRFAGKRIKVGSGVRIAKGCKIRTTGGGTVSIGRNTRLLDLVLLYTYGGDIRIGENCTFNPFCVIYGLGDLEIGDGCVVGAGAVVTKDLPAYSVAVGVPARVVGQRPSNTSQSGDRA